MTPSVSIIMSNFNKESYLRRTIDSVVAQTYSDWEFIIYDDCSTDGSRAIIDSYSDPRIKRIYMDTHEFMVYGFNYAITNSYGKYVAHIDSDDAWKPDFLRKQVEYLTSHPDCGGSFTLVNVVDENDKILSETDTELVKWFNTDNRSQAEWLRQFFINGSCLCHSTAMVPRSVLNHVGLYDITLRQIHDYELWVRIARNYPLHVIQERLVDYRWMSDGSNSSAPDSRITRRSNFEFSQVLKHYFDEIPDDLFIEAFEQDFSKPGIYDPDCLQIERMLLLLKPVFCGEPGKIGGVEKFMDLLKEKSTNQKMRDIYGIKQNDLYNITMTPMLYEPCSTTHQEHYEPIKTLDRIKKAIRSFFKS